MGKHHIAKHEVSTSQVWLDCFNRCRYCSKLEGIGLNQVKDRAGQPKYDEPAFTFSKRAANNDGVANTAPKLINVDGEPIDVSVGNGSEVTVKIKPYKNDFGQFAELMAVKVENLIEYVEGDTDNEEF